MRLFVVLWAAGCAAPCCPPAHTDTVGHGLSVAETGASVPELGEQTELAARHCQPSGQTVTHTSYTLTLSNYSYDV